MLTKGRPHSSIFGNRWDPANAAITLMLGLLFLLILLFVIFIASQPAQAQTYRVIYNFTWSGRDGATPNGLTLDDAGNLYGTAYIGAGGGNCAPYSCGTVFKLTKVDSAWSFTRLYAFLGGDDGQYPLSRVIWGTDGNLYGSTSGGGGEGCPQYGGCGTIFKITPVHPLPSASAGWSETLLYRFNGDDGWDPYGDLVFDQADNLYGTAPLNGSDGCGLVYKLTPSSNGWTQTVVHSFTFQDGCQPWAGVIFDHDRNLYGVTEAGGSAVFGTVFELIPSGAGWTLKTLYSFDYYVNGGLPLAALIFDRAGNLYGATSQGGSAGGGVIYRLSPSGENWNFTALYSLPGVENSYGPIDRLVMDADANLYGTTYQNGAYGCGSVFKLAPTGEDWTYTDLYDFSGGADGCNPSGVTLATSGKLYGTAGYGGSYGAGVVWEITP